MESRPPSASDAEPGGTRRGTASRDAPSDENVDPPRPGLDPVGRRRAPAAIEDVEAAFADPDVAHLGGR